MSEKFVLCHNPGSISSRECYPILGKGARRAMLVMEAMSWLGTPYHLGAMVKGAGCDCGTLLLGVAQACGFAKEQELEQFKQDWFCHTKDERYFLRLLRNAKKVVEAISYATMLAMPGDLVLTRHDKSARVYNHGGIVVKWPRVIHAVNPKVEEVDASTHWMWSNRIVVVFSLVES
jgi:cell wall-associated NlpC family hydrolase